ncbi:MAG TPA: hypothetical protein VMP01_01715 [Pirellulaceae bacterium]|nr:hypothetical protein [Pirellulaceae bacterium]
MAEHVDPIGDDELLYRRILAKDTNSFDPTRDTRPSAKAFHPNSRDVTGISLSRARSEAHPEFLTAEQVAARGRNPAGYYVAVLRAGDLRAAGIRLEVRPEPEDLGHIELPDVNYAHRKDDQVQAWKETLANRLTIQVLERFPAGSP